MYVGIHHWDKAHVLLPAGSASLKYANLVLRDHVRVWRFHAFMCVHVGQNIYGQCGGLHIYIINLNYTALFAQY